MSRLTYSIGCARSGKSTYAREWVKFFGKKINYSYPDNNPRVIVCSDNIRLALHGQRFSSHAETMVFAIKHIMIKSLLDNGNDVFVDGTHTTDISIRRLLEIDPNAIPVVFNTAKEICQERAVLTDQEDLIPVIERHHRQMTYLLNEGLDNVHARLIKEIGNRWGKIV
jgi:predicted kinase